MGESLELTIMMTLFSQEEVMDAYGEDCRRAGREEERESTALSMLRDKMSIANIMKFTHLPEERILELAKSL